MVNFRYLVTSALPYVNSRPHLGHLIGSLLPPDIYTRYLRLKGIETIYICGTDEHGTATELAAEKAGVTPEQWCTDYHKLHKSDYEWFDIEFTHFGRTSSPSNHELTQYIFKKNYDAGNVFEKDVEQLYCENCKRFLSDRYVKGTCPTCGEETDADQCDACGALQEPKELKSPKCVVCGHGAVLQTSKHLFLDLPKFAPQLKEWLGTKGFWAPNVKNWALSLVDDLKPRCITRDLKWGVDVPLEGFEDKVFYVWFDAPIGYIAITKDSGLDWHDWWTADDVRLVHFLGKDNIPFHTIIFPSMLLGTKEFILPYNVVGAEYLNYEGKKFSKSKGVGVTLEDCQSLPFTASQWRYALIQMAPEAHDSDFMWGQFQKSVNELADVVGNFVHRTVILSQKYYESVPEHGDWSEKDKELIEKIKAAPAGVSENLEKANLREALKRAVALVREGNAYLNEQEPWKNEANRANTLYLSLVVCRSASILLEPFIPSDAKKIRALLGERELKWDDAAEITIKGPLGESKPLFQKLDGIKEYEERFGGKPGAGASAPKAAVSPGAATPQKAKKEEVSYVKYEDFKKMDIRIAEVKAVERLEKSDKLYKIRLDVGELGERTVLAGLVPFYKEDELLGKKVTFLANLEPKELFGVKSEGMILAAGEDDAALLLPGKEVKPGTKIL
ncbi:methionine--tRNA ligase [archaeon]